jgi:hypothetical protein
MKLQEIVYLSIYLFSSPIVCCLGVIEQESNTQNQNFSEELYQKKTFCSIQLLFL